MCVNTRLVKNRYTGQTIRVKCGKCEACLQEKAAFRSNRIRNNMKDGYIALFATLTYANQHIPYFYRKDYCGTGFYNIYRDKDSRVLKDGKFKFYNLEKPVTTLYLEPDEFVGLNGVPDLVGYPERIGIILYSDFQKFFKRLRVYLSRNYGIREKSEYFIVCEYGAKTFRPHAHVLLFCRRDYESAYRSAIANAWQYDSCLPKRMRTEIARDAASYCSSYVNCGSDFPAFLKTNGIRQKHSYSKHFGVGLECFSLSKILEKVNSRALYYTRQTFLEGVPSISSYVVPKYVISRFFPLFKGYCRLAPVEVFDLLRYPESRSYLLYRRNRIDFVYGRKRYFIEGVANAFATLDYTNVDWHEFIVRLTHAYQDYFRVTMRSPLDYAIDYQQTWNLYFSTLLKNSYMKNDGTVIEDFSNFYENISDVAFGLVRAPTLDISKDFQYNPNERIDIVNSSVRLRDTYFKLNKSKKINSLALQKAKYNV